MDYFVSSIFVSSIKVKKVRNLRNLEISLAEKERKHLIITGKNGSGKTSLLEAASEILGGKSSAKFDIQLHINDSSYSFKEPDFVRLFVPAQREIQFKTSKTIGKVATIGTGIKPTSNARFIKYLVYWNYQMLVGENGNQKRNEKIDNIRKWFDNFKQVLRDVYRSPTLELEHDSENLNFIIRIPNYPPFGLNEMADGYSAFLKIVMDLMMRMGDPSEPHCEKQGIVLIDEIETHLHVELQKWVMPFLVKMFPNIQFVVSTHSPFVITSLDNAVVFDLENRQRMEDLSAYSYEGIIEYYYNSDMYSQKAKKLFEEYQKLSGKKRSEKDNERFAELLLQFDAIPPTVAPELFFAFKESETKRKGGNTGD